MKSSEKIESYLKKIKWYRFLRLVLQVGALIVALFLLSLFLQRVAEVYLFYHPLIVTLISGIVFGVAAVISIRIYFKENTSAIAREMDSEYQLKDRLSTYVELRNSNHPFLSALITESEQHLPQVSIRTAQMQKGALLPILLLSVFALCLATFPFWPVPQSLAARAEQNRQIRKYSRELIKEVEQIKQSTDTPPEIKKLAAEFQKMAERMNKPDVDPVKALEKMNEMRKNLSDLQLANEKERRQKFAKSLNAESSTKGKTTSEKQKDELQKEVESLQDQLKKEGLQGGEELQEKLQSGSLTREELNQMKKALEQYKSDKKLEEQKLAELQKSIEQAQKGMSSHKATITYNSKIKDRDFQNKRGGVEDGPGTTNQDAGPKHFDTKKKGESHYSEDRTKAEYEQLYSGQRENVGKDPLFLGSKWDAEKARYVRVRTFGEENESEIILDQTEAVPQSEAESVVSKEKIPVAYRDLIRRYFDSIQQ